MYGAPGEMDSIGLRATLGLRPAFATLQLPKLLERSFSNCGVRTKFSIPAYKKTTRKDGWF